MYKAIISKVRDFILALMYVCIQVRFRYFVFWSDGCRFRIRQYRKNGKMTRPLHGQESGINLPKRMLVDQIYFAGIM